MSITTEQKIARFLEAQGIQTESTGKFIGTLSNIYHGFESKIYDNHHINITASELHWQQILTKIMPHLPERIRVLDIGCGTGFASQQVIKAFGSRIERLVCTDLSPDMVEVCQRKLSSQFDRVWYLSGDLSCLSGANEQFDLVITNSLLHHLLDVPSFLGMVEKLIKPGGIYVAGHEPNKRFYQNPALLLRTNVFRNWQRVLKLLNPETYLSRLGIQKRAADLDHLTNEALIEQKLIPRPFPYGTITHLVDIHVPPMRATPNFFGEMGFNPHELCTQYLQDFTLIAEKTYAHVKDIRVFQSPLWLKIEENLSKKYPQEGADVIFAVQRAKSPTA